MEIESLLVQYLTFYLDVDKKILVSAISNDW